MNELNVEIKQIRKKFALYLFLWILGIFISLVPIIGGAILISQNDIIIGIVLLLFGIIAFVFSFIYAVKTYLKYQPMILKEFYDDLKKQLQFSNGKREFLSDENEKISFYDHYILCEGKTYSLSKTLFTYTIKHQATLTENFLFFYLTIAIELEDEEIKIIQLKLDRDVLNEIQKCYIEVVNQNDLDFFINNEDYLVHKRKFNIQNYAINQNTILFFVKNKEEQIIVKKSNIKGILIGLLMFCGFMGFYVITMWLGETEQGIEFSQQIGLDLIIKIGYSLAILLCIFIKSKSLHMISKLSLTIYLGAYWFSLFFLNERMFSLVHLIFGALLIFNGLFDFVKKKILKKPNRCLYVGFIISLFVVMDMLQYTYVDDDLIALISIIIAGILTIIFIPICVWYCKTKLKQEKKKLIMSISISSFCALFLSFIVIMISIFEFNYIFDTSTPILYQEEIVELRAGDEDTSDAAVVFIDGKEVEIFISDEEFLEYEIGDIIEFSLYQGAFGFEYFIKE